MPSSRARTNIPRDSAVEHNDATTMASDSGRGKTDTLSPADIKSHDSTSSRGSPTRSAQPLSTNTGPTNDMATDDEYSDAPDVQEQCDAEKVS